MIMDKDNFYKNIEVFFEKIEGKIEKVEELEFSKVFGSESASKNKNIVYLWRCENNIKRLKGESDIIYIGQTKQSFKNRYLTYAKKEATTKANKLKYEAIIEQYGAISIYVCDFSIFGDNLLKSEGQLLWWYFENHCEYPPINYTQTKIRNSIREYEKGSLSN